jgi:hypothetical protein
MQLSLTVLKAMYDESNPYILSNYSNGMLAKMPILKFEGYVMYELKDSSNARSLVIHLLQ